MEVKCINGPPDHVLKGLNKMDKAEMTPGDKLHFFSGGFSSVCWKYQRGS